MNKIKNKILHFLTHAKKFLKEALNVEKKFFYLFLFAASFILFTLILFPFDKLLLGRINSSKFPQFKSLSIENADISLFGLDVITGIDMVLLNNNRLSVSELKTDLSFLKLYFSRKFDGNFYINKMSFKTLKSEFAGKVTAKCSFKLNDKYYPLGGEADISGENVILEGVSIKGFDFEKITIKSLDSKIAFENNIISIKEFMFSGRDLSGKIRGTIRLNSVFRNSGLNITIDISAASTVLKDFEMFLNQYINPNSNTITIEITGTVSTPSVNLKKSQ
ncbi:MAG: type II secretion system protein GspN [Spirochaetes bacterium]|nr:type II secretion system protein GspN [Spirochaetota bacterium]